MILLRKYIMKKYKFSIVALLKFLVCLVVVIIFIIGMYNLFSRNNSHSNTDKYATKIEDTHDDEKTTKENDISSSENEHSAIVVCGELLGN